MEQMSLTDFLEFIKNKHGEENENWITVYKRIKNKNNSVDGSLYCALVSQEKTNKAMKTPYWELPLGTGAPGFEISMENEVEKYKYYRETDKEFRRLVHYRDFSNCKENYFEVLEEFRFLYNLYHDKKTGIHYAFDEAGDEIEVIKQSQEEVKIRRSYLQDFISAIQMNLLLYFQFTRHCNIEQTSSISNIQSNSMCSEYYTGPGCVKSYNFFERVLGKKLLRYKPIENCGAIPFRKIKIYQEFIIGGDIDKPYWHSCNPDKLSNKSGENPNNPCYMTPVFFKKEVMRKYYNSSEYEVTDGYLTRQGVWSLPLDNDLPKHVSVFLGDLGSRLPENEQIHWKSQNIIPDGLEISETNLKRSIFGHFSDPESPEHKFKHTFQQLQEIWKKKLGWFLFLPLTKGDQHHFSSIRSMLNTEQSEFDEQIISLTKLTIDSVNIQDIRNYLKNKDTEKKSIELLEELFEKINLTDTKKHIKFLQKLQSLRSSGAAHRKGKTYTNNLQRYKIDNENYQNEFDKLLTEFSSLCNQIQQAILSIPESASSEE